jgi:hypothetical protein
MPATALIRALNSEESEDTRGDYFTGRQRPPGATTWRPVSHSPFGCFWWLLPAIDLPVA